MIRQLIKSLSAALEAFALIFSPVNASVPDMTAQSVTNDQQTVRVALAYGENSRDCVTLSSDGSLLIGFFDGGTFHPIANESAGIVVISAGENGSFDINGPYGSVSLSYAGACPLAVVSDTGLISFPCDDELYEYGGYIEFSANDNGFSIINTVGLEDYVKGVLPYEIGTNESDETTKAFAVLTRTVPLSKSKPAHLEDGFDVCTSTCCQIYRGFLKRDERLEGIADETKGEILSYDGKPATVLYHTVSGGATCSLCEAWGGEDLPYLRSVDVGEPYEESANGSWKVYYTMDKLTVLLKEYGGPFTALEGDVTDIRISRTDKYGSGYVTRITATDEYGTEASLEYSAPIREALGLKSANFTLTRADITRPDGTVKVSGIIISGKGYGHGVGLSGTGAEYLSNELGMDYLSILEKYFPGTAVVDLNTVKWLSFLTKSKFLDY